MRKVIISVAPTSAASTEINPEKLAREVIEARKAGAAMVHMHIRDRAGKLTEDLSVYKETIEKITAGCDIVLQASTGGVSELNIRQRCAPVALEAVESVSLNVGSVNLGEAVYQNPINDVEYCVQEIIKHKKFPEIEVFELGMIHTVQELDKKFNLPKPIFYDIVLGHRGEMPATIDALVAMRSFLPKGALWGITHANRRDYSVMAAAIAMGASLVRIGFEDSDWLSETEKAQDNVQLVARIAEIIRVMGFELATPQDIRAMMALGNTSVLFS